MNNETKLELIPAIMPVIFSDIQRDTDIISVFALSVQIDVMDGVFVPSTSWPYGNGQWNEVEQLAQGLLELPHRARMHYEAHLMVSDPEHVGELFARAGVERLIVHVETLEDIDVEHMCASWKSTGATEIGLAVRLDTPATNLESCIEFFQFIQVMGIEKIGFQGEAMDMRAIEQAHELRTAYPTMPIEFDGGANMNTIHTIVSSGVSRVVAGSAILAAPQPRLAYDELLQALVDNQSPEANANATL